MEVAVGRIHMQFDKCMRVCAYEMSDEVIITLLYVEDKLQA